MDIYHCNFLIENLFSTRSRFLVPNQISNLGYLSTLTVSVVNFIQSRILCVYLFDTHLSILLLFVYRWSFLIRAHIFALFLTFNLLYLLLIPFLLWIHPPTLFLCYLNCPFIYSSGNFSTLGKGIFFWFNQILTLQLFIFYFDWKSNESRKWFTLKCTKRFGRWLSFTRSIKHFLFISIFDWLLMLGLPLIVHALSSLGFCK